MLDEPIPRGLGGAFEFSEIDNPVIPFDDQQLLGLAGPGICRQFLISEGRR
jgi:hypothetical protein